MSDEAQEIVEAGQTEEKAAPKRRVFGGAAEAALSERWQKAGEEELVYVFRGEEYRVSPVPLAGAALGAASVEATGDVEGLLDLVRGTFLGDDGARMVAAIKDTGAENPADFDFVLEMLKEIDENLVNRPPTS